MIVNNDKKERLFLAQWRRIAVIFVLILLTLISLITISKGMSKDPQMSDILYSYQLNDDINYKVYLYDNSFYDEEYLEMGKTYTSSLVKNINTNMLYNYSNSKKDYLKYTYGVTATIIANYGDGTNDTVWNKKYTLLEPVTKTEQQGNNININQNINIDFKKYSDAVEEYKKQLKLSISAYLDVTMKVEVKNGAFTDNREISMKIPLSDSTTKFTLKTDKPENKTVFKENSQINKTNNQQVLLGSILLTFCVVTFMLTFRSLFNITKKSQYQLLLNKILKSYGEVIIEVNNPINLTKNKIIEVKTIEDMIDIEEELKIPIEYYEEIEDEEGWFIIEHSEKTYRFILSYLDRDVNKIKIKKNSNLDNKNIPKKKINKSKKKQK